MDHGLPSALESYIISKGTQVFAMDEFWYSDERSFENSYRLDQPAAGRVQDNLF